jgi:hypothetical protein
MGTHKVVEKNNVHALHAICWSYSQAEKWINKYGDSGMFTNKSLKKDSFKIIKIN